MRKVRILQYLTTSFVKWFNSSIHLYRQIEEHTCVRKKSRREWRRESGERGLKYDIMNSELKYTFRNALVGLSVP